MNLILKIIYIVFGTIFSLLWIYFAKKSAGLYDEQIESIDTKEYFLPELFSLGYYCIETFNINMNSIFFRKKKSKLLQVKGENADFYLYTIFAAQISYTMTILPLGFTFSLLADSGIMLLLFIGLAIILIVYLETEINNLLEEKEIEIKRDLPNILTKLCLLTNAGMILRDAWDVVCETGDRVLYKEMRNASYEMDNGISIRVALSHLSERCDIKEVKKMCSTIEQNIDKGSSELAKSLRELSNESWNEKKQLAIQKGAATDSKLLIPTAIIFMGILFLIMVSIFTNML